ncbi:MAG: four helix bundle protein [Bacteroidetes bacterium]|nr:four helix bundle protein [Bacteroidota bacterium]
MFNFTELTVWRKSMDLVTAIYLVTKDFPSDEKFGLINQMRRCAVSIPSNIAEGASRRHKKEFAQFLRISLGSNSELQTQLLISKNLEFIKSSDCEPLIIQIEEISKMISGLIKSIE